MPDRSTEVLGARRVVAAEAARDREPDDLAPGAQVGSWQITSKIAEGGCGVVYAARHSVLDRVAAVKILRAGLAQSPDMVDRFVREARAVNHIKHPNIIDIFDCGALADGRPYFVMELLAPDDLQQRLDAGGRRTIAEAVAIATPVCLALDAAHRAGYVHRDLKARNIGFARRAGGEQVVLLDFGVAKLIEAGRARTGTVRVGTPSCMSPEQIRGEPIDARTDVYALGVLLYHLLVGRTPFHGSLAEVEQLHLEAPPPVPSRFAPVPVALDAVVTRALAKRPADRQPSALALLAELTQAAAATHSRVTDAIGVRVELELPDALDDALLDAAAAGAARAAAVLRDHGFTPVLVTGTGAVAADLLGDDPAAVRARATAVADALATALAAQPAPWRIACREAAVEVDAAGALVGGPLLELHDWPS